MNEPIVGKASPEDTPQARSVRGPVALSLLALSLGLLTEILFYGHRPGISFFLLAAACCAVAVVAGRLERVRISRSTWLAVAGVLTASVATFLRQEPLTVFLCLMLTFFFLALTVRVFRFGRLGHFGWADLAVAFLWVPLEAWIRPWPVAIEAWSSTVHERGGRKVAFSVVRGVLLALPFLVIFIALLSAADLVFGDFVERVLSWIDLDTLIDWTARSLVILVSAVFFLGGLVAAVRSPAGRKLIGEDSPLIRPFLGFTETTIVLSLVLLVFLAFVGVQFAYLFGGEANIDAAGYTYAEYARRGFGELVAVASLALGMIYLLASVTRLSTRRQRTAFVLLCGGVVLLVSVMLISAYQRLVLYEQAYGFSRLRTYTHVAIAWLAVALFVFLAVIVLGRLRQLAPAAVLLTCGFTLSLVLVNVDAFIVDRNGDRYLASGDLDVDYLSSLSDDAIPGMVNLVPQTEGQTAEEMLAVLACRRRTIAALEARLQWPSAHASRTRALASLATIDGELDAFPVTMDANRTREWGWLSYEVQTSYGAKPCPATPLD